MFKNSSILISGGSLIPIMNLLIAHRLSMAEKCDQIALFEQCKIIAKGTFDGLIGSNQNFRTTAMDHKDGGDQWDDVSSRIGIDDGV